MRTIFIIFNKLINTIIVFISKIYTCFILYIYNAEFSNDISVKGFPVIKLLSKGKITIGQRFRMNNGRRFNIIGRQQPCYFIVYGRLIIKNNVGISSTAIVCKSKITIMDNVRIGGNVVIYDTDFHSMDINIRISGKNDFEHANAKEIIINKNVFIGAHSIILKGVTIGENSIIGAGSVVSKDIPSNEIWAGNPARLIKKFHLE